DLKGCPDFSYNVYKYRGPTVLYVERTPQQRIRPRTHAAERQCISQWILAILSLFRERYRSRKSRSSVEGAMSQGQRGLEDANKAGRAICVRACPSRRLSYQARRVRVMQRVVLPKGYGSA